MCEETEQLREKLRAAAVEAGGEEDVTERHWGECVQIAHYQEEARQMREDIERLLTRPFEACRMCRHWDGRGKCNGCEPEYNINWRKERA